MKTSRRSCEEDLRWYTSKNVRLWLLLSSHRSRTCRRSSGHRTPRFSETTSKCVQRLLVYEGFTYIA